MKKWKYYNHAMIPTAAPHEEIDAEPFNNKQFWNENKKALLARWTSEFDCGYETNWWYVIKDEPLDISSLKSKRRYEINKGKKNYVVRPIDANQYANDLYNITIAAYTSWPAKYRPSIDRDVFFESLNRWSEYIVYGAFSVDNERMSGYAYLKDMVTYYNFVSLRVIPESEKKGINAAIVTKILEDYTEKGDFSKYICDGERCINHETNFQDYLEKYFGFRKAYCKLHIVYKPQIKWVIKTIYPFRKIFHRFDEIGFVHQINSVLYMEELCRSEAEDD